MRTCAAVLFILLCAAAEGGDTSLANALRNGAYANVRIKVVEVDGTPVTNAIVSGGFTAGSNWMTDYVSVRGHTDAHGVCIAEGRCTDFLRYDVRKEGYYSAEERVYFSRTKAKPPVEDGKWQPYGEERKVVLKKIRNPIQMRGRRVQKYYPFPAFDRWLGFDLGQCDWVAPLGQGTHSDVLIKFKYEKRDIGYYRSMEISFTNSPYAGVYVMEKDSQSEMKSTYEASPNGVYTDNILYEFERTERGANVVKKLEGNQYLVFRTRTKVDAEGKLESAHYGKIHGDWRFYEPGGMALGPVFFNPTPNDTNLEDAETARLSRLAYEQNLEFERKRKENHKSLWPF